MSPPLASPRLRLKVVEPLPSSHVSTCQDFLLFLVVALSLCSSLCGPQTGGPRRACRRPRGSCRCSIVSWRMSSVLDFVLHGSDEEQWGSGEGALDQPVDLTLGGVREF